jgi:NADPH-dependent ferric siderophore reductase
MTRVTLAGDDLSGYAKAEPAASVRLLLPDGELVLPLWGGNNFVLPSGERPTMRTFTPRHYRPDVNELDIDIVLHPGGSAATWATDLAVDAEVAVSGPGGGYEADPGAEAFLLIGDESAIPAICQLLESLPDVPIVVHIEITEPAARVGLHREVAEYWHVQEKGAPSGDSLVSAIESAGLTEGVRIWGAGEAAAMQRIRKHLFGNRDLPRSQAHIRGYWKSGR